MSRRLPSLALIAAAAAQLLSVSAASAITGGSPDDSHPYVAAVIWPSIGHPTCTGVWTDIGQRRRVLVTDAHCVPKVRGARVRVYFGRSWHSGASTVPGRSYRHPAYDAHTHRNDVAVVLLDRDPHVSPAVLARTGAAQTAHRVVVVGYGSPHSGQRRSATEVTTSWSSWRLYLRPGSGNSCGGDSGGPDLLPGTRQIVALTDEGTCSRDEDTRVDAGSARSFLLGAH